MGINMDYRYLYNLPLRKFLYHMLPCGLCKQKCFFDGSSMKEGVKKIRQKYLTHVSQSYIFHIDSHLKNVLESSKEAFYYLYLHHSQCLCKIIHIQWVHYHHCQSVQIQCTYILYIRRKTNSLIYGIYNYLEIGWKYTSVLSIVYCLNI